MTTRALLFTALLIGGMVLCSFGFAAFLFTALPAEPAGQTLRRTFPHFYLFVTGAAVASAIRLAAVDPLSAAIMAAMAAKILSTPRMQAAHAALPCCTGCRWPSRWHISWPPLMCCIALPIDFCGSKPHMAFIAAPPREQAAPAQTGRIGDTKLSSPSRRVPDAVQTDRDAPALS